MLKAEIYISLKKTIADPQGLAIKHALESLGYKETKDVRTGKLINLRLNINNQETAKKRLNEMCRKLLANPIIEDYRFQIKEA